MTDKKQVAVFILEGDPQRFAQFLVGLPLGTEVVEVETKDEARALLAKRSDITFIGTSTHTGNGIFRRDLGIAKMEGREY